MNRDFAEMLDALSGAGADFLIVGAHALAAHGRVRAILPTSMISKGSEFGGADGARTRDLRRDRPAF
jgi:hypothetical protein